MLSNANIVESTRSSIFDGRMYPSLKFIFPSQIDFTSDPLRDIPASKVSIIS